MHYSARNSTEIEKLNPIVKDKVNLILEEADSKGLNILITDGFRSNAEQTKLYNQGRTTKGKVVTNAKAGYSFHNYGLAIDIVPVGKDGDILYGDYETYKEFAAIAKSHGFTWGDEWKFKDTPHFEYTQGKAVEYFLRGGTLTPEIKNDKIPEWAIPIVNYCKKNGVITDLNTKVGELPLYHLLAIIKKSKLHTL